MNFVNYYRARKRYYSMLIYTKIYSDIKNSQELEMLREEFDNAKRDIQEDELPLFDRILDVEDLLMNCDEESFKKQFESKTGEYYQKLLEREELYRAIFDKTKVIATLYSIEQIKPVVIKGKVGGELEIQHGELLEPLLNYVNIFVKYVDGKLVDTDSNDYDIILSAPYKYIVRKSERENVDRLVHEIEQIQLKLQVEIALRQIEDPDKEREEIFKENQERYLKLRALLENYDVNNLLDKVRAVFKN
ncbi:MAG: hypothetical protein QW336_01975 [Candidatus Anstonellales archaeon]